MTGNWYAAFSSDGGESFQFVNPDTAFPSTATHRVCCDQVAIYSPEHDLMIWFLQYTQDGHSNIVRLAVCQGDDIPEQNWRYFDFSPESIGGWEDEWFDFPDMALNAEHLFITTNSFATQGTADVEDDEFARAVALRLPLEALAEYETVTPDFFQSEEAFSLRPTQGANQGTMYFGSHDFANFGGKIVVYSWSEEDDSVGTISVDVAPWSNASRFSECPDGNRWLDRCDFRMTAAWAEGTRAGFAWTAAQDNTFEHPHVRVAVVDVPAGKVVAEPHLWNAEFAYAYPAAALGSDGAVGFSVCFGGGGEKGRNVSHAVGVLRGTDDGEYNWNLTSTHTGTNGPVGGRWGDYLALRPHGGGIGWVASGFTLDGGSLAQSVLPRYVHFRASDILPEGSSTDKRLTEVRQDLQRIRDQVEAAIERIDQQRRPQRPDVPRRPPRKSAQPKARSDQGR
jgi:hypothetical protein